MIRDYKFNAKLTDRRVKKGGRIGVFLASSVLAGIIFALRLHDSTAILPAEQPQTTSLSKGDTGGKAQALRITAPLMISRENSNGQDSNAPLAKMAARTEAPAINSDRTLSLLPSEGKQTEKQAGDKPVGPLQAEPVSQQPTVAALIEEPPEPSSPPSKHKAPEESVEPVAVTSDTSVAPTWKEHRVVKGETLAGIFKNYRLSATTLYRVLHAAPEAKTLARIRPGQLLKLQLSPAGELKQLVFAKSPIATLRISRTEEGFKAQLDEKAIEHKTAAISGTIESSLFVDGQKAGLSDAQIMELADIFGWDIDFALEIRAGDQFRVIFDQQFVDGKKYRNGPILAAEFVNRGRTYQAYRFETADQVGYYDAEGRSKRRAFIRTPIKFARISSRFTPRRWHPILKRWKSHKGVDYAAPKGTPIKVTGNGRVVFRGWQRGYGRVVIVQHSSKYKTVYAHMSRFRSSVKKGTRVKQGQVIGYVGQSGWATGPHLHYEFRVNNVQRNPLTVKLPKSLPLPRRQLAAFKRKIRPLTLQLASIRQATMVAKADDH